MRKLIFILLTGICVYPVYAQQSEPAPLALEVYDSSTGQTARVQIDNTRMEIAAAAPTENIETNEALSLAAFDGESSIRQVKDNRIVLLYAGGPQKMQCSGAMVGPYTVLTAGHCVADNKGNIVKASSIKAYVGGSESGLVATGNKIFYSRLATIPGGHDYSNIILRNSDIAIVVLDKPLGRKTGYFGVWSPPLAVGMSIEVRGFPGSKAKNKPWLSRGVVVGEDVMAGGPLVGLLTHGSIIYGPSFAHLAFVESGSSGAPNFLTGSGDKIFAVTASGGWAFNFSSRGLLSTLVSKYRQATPQNVPQQISKQLAKNLRHR